MISTVAVVKQRITSEPASTTELSLSQLADAINREYQLCQEAYKASLIHACKTGEFLLQAKNKVKHSSVGRWLPWLAQNCPSIPKRTAQAYMQIAANWELLEKSATVALFGIKDALKFLAEKKGIEKPAASETNLTDVIDAEWTQASPLIKERDSVSDEATLLQNMRYRYPSTQLAVRDRVVVTEPHPLFAGQHGVITGRPSLDTAVVALDEGERERILVDQLQLEEIPNTPTGISESKSQEWHLLPYTQSNSDIPPNKTAPNPDAMATVALVQGKPDAVVVEIAIGIRHLSPEELALAITAAADNGLSDAHLKAAAKAAKQALNRRNHAEYNAHQKSTGT